MTTMRKRQPKKQAKQVAVQNKAWPSWTPIGTHSVIGSDWYGRDQPTPAQLINAFEDTVYACASLISDTVASTPVKLFVTTDPGQARPKCPTRPLTSKALARIKREKGIVRGSRIEEVASHPILDLLGKCNSYHNRLDFLSLTQLYLEITGNAFWLIKPDPWGLPAKLYLLPSQMVTPVRDERGLVTHWKFGQGSEQEVYSTDQVLHFKYPNLADPYGLGYAPLHAAWNRVRVQFMELGFLTANLTNFGRPDAILAPQEPISPFEAERLAKDFIQRFRGQGAGGVFVADGPMQVTPISWPAKDFAELQLYQTVKNSVSNVFHIPPDIWEMGEANRATAEAILYALAVHCIKPRMSRLVTTLNDRLIPLFDQGQGRLFFEAEQVVPEDKDFELRERQMLLSSGVLTRNEVRQLYGFDGADWAQEPLLPPGSMPAVAPDDPLPPVVEQPQDRSAQAPAIAALQQAVYAGELPREAAIANVRLSFGYSPNDAEALFPNVQPVKLTPDIPAQQVPELPPVKSKCGGEGGKPGPCPEPGAGDKPSHPPGSPEHLKQADGHAKSLVQRIKEVPAKLMEKARTKVTGIYSKLEARYGKPTAIAIMGAGLLGVPLPIPGSSLITAAPVLAAAELYIRLRKSKAQGSLTLKPDEIAAAAKPIAELHRDRKDLQVPDVRQQYEYDCGPSATMSVCRMFGVGPETEAEYITALGTTEASGTPPERIVAYLQSVGLTVEARDDLTPADLARATASGSPVIVPIQDYEENPEQISQEASGHYVVITGADDDTVRLQDPSAGPQEMTTVDFLSRWEDTDGQDQFIHYGIIVSKTGDTKGEKKLKTLRRKSAIDLAKALRTFFATQKAAMLAKLKTGKRIISKNLPLSNWFDIEHWSEEMYRTLRPVIALYYDESARQTMQRLGGSFDLLKVVQPQLAKGIDRSTMIFCRETNATTSMELDTAIKSLRQSLTEGLQAGEVQNQLSQRVQDIFDRAEVTRAYLVAHTEASRAQHAAQEITAIESGVAKGKRWLLSSDACEKCLPLADKVVPLGQNFMTLESGGPYAEIPYPPLHPGCRCDVVEVVDYGKAMHKCGGEGGKPGPCPEPGADQDGGHEDHASYVEAFNENPHTVTSDEVSSANRELEDSGSDYRIVPSEDGSGFTAMTQDELESEYGENWSVDVDPDSGKLQAGDGNYFHDRSNELADNPSEWATTLNGRDVNPDDVTRLSEYLNSNPDKTDAIIPDPDTGKWEVWDKADVAEQYGDDWSIQNDKGKWRIGVPNDSA